MSFNDFDRQPFVGKQKNPEQLDEVDENVNIAANIGLCWQGLDCVFHDWLYLDHIRPGHDLLPAGLAAKLDGKKTGAQIEHIYPAGQLVAGWHPDRQSELDTARFKAPDNARFGRFYPADYVPTGNETQAVGSNHCRIVRASKDRVTLDCNHPLSRHEIRLLLQIRSIHRAGTGDPGPGRDIAAMLCDQGPGMQDRLPQQDTDFFSARSFQRLDEGDDAEFFREPSLTPFWDQRALLEVSQLYQQLIPPQADILDLMAGVHSPLQQTDLEIASLHCAGLNAAELEHNPSCDHRRVLDVNRIQALPYQDQQFDVVLIHAAIEYVIQPQLLFSEISRVLKSAGRIIVSFTNRHLPEKAIQLWREAYDFERTAIVLSYLRASRGFANFSSHSQRGLSRLPDDELTADLQHSDPVFMVWADKVSK